ncbi:MAG TPA: bifunctional diguanylate cyclase/phosphodiesterase [Gammaproteobacteria bacterium]|nr:bifunctional diguanylate cyclase/phosphodiesterase [Gammaproteobacteria bacterium]
MDDVLCAVTPRDSLVRRLARHLDGCRRQGTVAAVVILDVHRFRDVNACFGYQAADRLLGALCARLKTALRDEDELVRINGDEFAVILPRLVNEDHVNLAANKILKTLASPFVADRRPVQLKATLGIALYPLHAAECEGLLLRADWALRHARANGLDYMVFNEQCRLSRQGPLLMESELKRALDDNELVLHFQPKIDLSTGHVCGAESLARWLHPDKGLVFPDTFIPVAEQTGLIVPLTLWSLNAALMQCAACRRKWDWLSVAVNLSPRVLHDPDVVDLVARALRIWGTDPGHLTLEITEGAMMLDPARSLETLRRIHDLGVVLSIDDFGTGYSSLAYLKKLPVRELKIDKSFVLNMAEDEDDAKIVRSIIDLAHNFDLAVIAEGVENQATLERLTAMGCDYAQGFHVARPMDADDVGRWMFESRFGPQDADPLDSCGGSGAGNDR